MNNVAESLLNLATGLSPAINDEWLRLASRKSLVGRSTIELL